MPPVAEQREILGFLKDSSFDLDRTLAATHREISLLREYRVRLIADVVTGKLDVREAAARLLDGVDELEPLDEAEVDVDVESDAADEFDAVPEETEA